MEYGVNVLSMDPPKKDMSPFAKMIYEQNMRSRMMKETSLKLGKILLTG